MNVVQSSRSPTLLNTSVLSRLAERWRPAGLYLACFGRDGALLWHDSQMPKLLALCTTTDNAITRHLHDITDGKDGEKVSTITPLPGLHAFLTPIVRRRKVSAWIAVLARTQTITISEDLQRLASRAAMDGHTLVLQSARIPLNNLTHLPALVNLISQMHEDMLNTAMSQHELSSVTEQLSCVYEEINLLYRVSSGMRFSQKPQAFLETVCRETQEIGNFRAVAVALAHREDETSQPVLGEVAVLSGSCPLKGPELINSLHAPIQESLSLGEPRIHNDLTGASDYLRLRTTMQRFIAVPLMRDERPLGILLAIDKNDHSEFTSVDLKLLNNVASQCAIFLENASLYQDTQDLFLGILHALTRSIDAKDAYTRGHSQRVAELSRMLARKIGLPEDQCERIYLAGLLHDVGKIGVPEGVLTKPGRLTDAEFESIKKHPSIGAQILGNIKQLQDVIPGVLYHHERWDGRGYPYGLAGDAIPLAGRIICIADSFDAMSSTRTYRPALPLDTVLAEIKRCAGSQFDQALAKIFVTLDFSSHHHSVQEQLLLARQGPEENAP